MKCFLIAILAMLFFAAAASADDNVRLAQTKLREGGFYLGQVDGAPSSDLSAAITRYQIRNGLRITGNLNPETIKALGVKAQANVADSAAPPGADTWRQLRRHDQKFLSQKNESETSAQGQPNGTPVPASKSATAALVPLDDGDNSKMVLSRERLRDYVAAFVLAGLDRQVGAELEFFADHVRYYNQGTLEREKIRGDLQHYAARWPQRSFRLAGDLQVTPQADSRIRVTFPLQFELRNSSKHSSGKVRKTLLLEVVGEDLQIVGVDETKA